MAVLVLTVNLKWNRLNFVSLHTDKLLKFKTPNFRGCPGGDLCSSCLGGCPPTPGLCWPVPGTQPGDCTGVCSLWPHRADSWPESHCSQPYSHSCAWEQLVPPSLGPVDPEPTLSLQGLPPTSPPEHLKAGVSPTLGDF